MSKTELAKMDGIPINSMADLEKMGEALAKSCMFGAETTQAGMIIVATCKQEGLSFLQFQRTYDIIQGKPAMKSGAMLGAFQAGGGEYQIVQRNAEGAELIASFGSNKDVNFRISWDDLKDEPYTKKKGGKIFKETWATPRGRTAMIWARLISDMVRAMAPSIVHGVYTPEETYVFDDPHKIENVAGTDSIVQDDEVEFLEPVVLDASAAYEKFAAMTEVSTDEPMVPSEGGNIPEEALFSPKGKRWAEYDVAKLKGFLKLPASKAKEYGLTPDHMQAIVLTIGSKKSEGGAS